jgi:putative ABC-2 type transporter
MRKIIELLKCDLKIFVREPMGALFIIFFPEIIMIANFFIDSQGEYLTEMMAGTIGLSIMSSGIMGVAIVIGVNRETNVYKRYQISNMKEYMLFSSIFIVQMLLTTSSVISQFLLAITLYGSAKFSDINGFVFVIDYLISISLLFSIGLFLSSVVKSLKNLHGIASIFFTVMMLLCGSAFPISKMPSLMQKIVMILPLSHINISIYQDLEGICANKFIFYIYAIFFSILCFGLGIKHFKWEAV